MRGQMPASIGIVRRPDYRRTSCASRKLEIKLLNLLGIPLSSDYFRAPGRLPVLVSWATRRAKRRKRSASATIGLRLMTVAQSASSQNPTISTSARI
jgi:hypothetical protein